MPSAALDLVPPAYLWMPEYPKTLGDEVSDLAVLAGFAPDPEQQLALDMLFALGDNGRSAIRDMGVCAPRQNLKTGFLKQAALGWLYITEQRLVVWSAHEFSTAQEAFRDMCALIESCPDLDREVKAIHRGNGEEAIELLGDRRLRFKARTKVGGRGLTGNKIVLDEAMYLQQAHMGALVPTLRAVPDPQLVLAGSAGMRESEVWRSYRDAGRAKSDETLGWLEYADLKPETCADPLCDHVYGIEGCALDDRARWWATNTALGRRITEDTLASDRRRLPAWEFARETLCWWEDPPTGGGVLDLDLWSDLTDPSVAQADRVAYSLEVGLGRTSATIGAAWQGPQGPHLTIAKHASGTDWIVSTLTATRESRGSLDVTLDAGTEALSFKDELEAEGITVHVTKSADRAAMCGRFHDASLQRSLTHDGQELVTRAIAGATWREGTQGARSFARKGGADISPLYALVLALEGLAHETAPPAAPLALTTSRSDGLTDSIADMTF